LCAAKKKFERVFDNCGGNIGAYWATYVGVVRRVLASPSYEEHFAFWVLQRRTLYRQSSAVAFGCRVALGFIIPGSEYYESIATDEEEANLLRRQDDALRRIFDVQNH